MLFLCCSFFVTVVVNCLRPVEMKLRFLLVCSCSRLDTPRNFRRPRKNSLFCGMVQNSMPRICDIVDIYFRTLNYGADYAKDERTPERIYVKSLAIFVKILPGFYFYPKKESCEYHLGVPCFAVVFASVKTFFWFGPECTLHVPNLYLCR